MLKHGTSKLERKACELLEEYYDSALIAAPDIELLTAIDPHYPNVVAVRVVTPRDHWQAHNNDTDDYVVTVPDRELRFGDSNDAVEEVEFTSWPPSVKGHKPVKPQGEPQWADGQEYET